MLTRIPGVDVSGNQGDLTQAKWNSAFSAGYKFGWTKATEGLTFNDTTFSNNITRGKAAGIMMGAYHFARYDNQVGTSGASSEENHFWGIISSTLTNDGKSFVPALDIEDISSTEGPGNDGYTKTTLSQWVVQFCSDLKADMTAAGITLTPIIYTGASFAGTWLDSTVSASFPIWMANYNGLNRDTGSPFKNASGTQVYGAPYKTPDGWQFWQYSSTNAIPGFATVDSSVFTGDQLDLHNYIVGATPRWAVNDRVTSLTGATVYTTSAGTGTGTSISAGNKGTILAGPVFGTSFWLWQVNFDGVTDGWVAQDYLDTLTPAAPTNPNPAINASLASLPANFTWTAGTDASSYKVYLDNVLQSTQTSTSWAHGAIGQGGHTWRVDALNGEFLTTGTTWNFTYSAVTTLSGVSSTLADGSYHAGTTVPITVTYNNAVTVNTAGGTPTIALNDGGTATYASGSGTTTLTFNYVIAAGENVSDLDYSSTGALSLNGGTIKDGSNNNAPTTLPTPGAANSLGANKNITIDNIAPTVTNVTSTAADGIYAAGAVIPITITFSEAVTKSFTPLLALNSGGSASYASGNGASTFTFNYTVAAGQSSSDLDYASINALTGNMHDVAGNPLVATLATPGALHSISFAKNIVVDAVAPAVASIVRVGSNPNNTSTESWTVTFSESVTGVTLDDFSLVGAGASGASLSNVNGSGNVYTVTASSGADGALGLNLVDDDTIVDAAANKLGGTGTGNGNFTGQTITVDRTLPTATLGSETPTQGSSTFDFTITFSDGGSGVDISTLDSSDVTVTGPGGFNAGASFISVDVASNGSPRVATYRINAPGGTWDAADNGTYTISLNGSEVRDVATNAVVAGSLGDVVVTNPFAYLSGSTLVIEYAAGQSSAAISDDGSGNIVVTEGSPLSFASGAFSDIAVHGTSGNDMVVIATALAKPLTLTAPGGNDAISIANGGSYTFASDIGAGGSVAVTVDAGGVATFAANQHLAGLTINGIASIASGAGVTIATSGLAVAGKLDVADGAIAVNYSGASPIGAWNGSAYDGITGAIASGRNSGAWDGASGIVTTQPQALTGVTTVGVSEASSALGLGVGATGTWRGEVVDDTTVLIRYTYAGDCNLSGDITGDDYFLIDAGYAGAANGYGNGDLDFSGSINADDYFVIDSNYNKAVVPLAAPLPNAAAGSEGMFFAQPAKAFAPASDSQTDQKLLDELL